MQPYPPSPDLVWPGHLHGTGCLSARAMDTRFPTVVWRLCLGRGCAWVWVSVTPPALAGVLGGCVWVRFVVLPLFSPLGFAVFAVGLGFRPAPHLSWLGFCDVRGCVRAPPAPRRSRFWCAVWTCVLRSGLWLRPAFPWGGVGVCVCLCARPAWPPAPPGWGCGAGVCGWAWVAAAPRHSWLGCWGVCVFMCAPRLYLAFPGWGVMCRRVCWAWVLAAPLPLLVGLLGCVCGRACATPAPALPRGAPLARGCAGVAVGGVCPPSSPLVFFLASFCRSLVVQVWGHVVSVPPSLLFRAALFFCFFSSKRGVCPAVLGVPSPGGPLPLAWCCRFWLGDPSVPLWGYGRLLWCWWAVWWLWAVLAPPPPVLFFAGGSACSSLCLPLAGARTGRHSVWSSVLLLVVAFCQAVPRPHGPGGLCTCWAGRPFLPG